jgi:hypothetical protein
MRYCLWGWRRGYIQIGGDLDRGMQRMLTDVYGAARQIGGRLLPVVEALAREVAAVVTALR